MPATKSKYMIITKKRNVGPISVIIDKSDLDECDFYKYLGVMFDKGLRKNQTDHICGKITTLVPGISDSGISDNSPFSDKSQFRTKGTLFGKTCPIT